MRATTCSESDRLVALRSLNVLDTAPEEHFEAVCRTARRLFGVEHAVITLIDTERQWLKSRCSAVPVEVPRSDSFCDHTIRDDAPLVVPDATKDPRFADLAIVTGSTNLRFYAGAPLIVSAGIRVGALCLIDSVPRSFSEEDGAALSDLAAIVVAHLRLGESNALLERETIAREQSEKTHAISEARHRDLAHGMPLLVWTTSESDGRINFANERFDRFCGSNCRQHSDLIDLVHETNRFLLEARWSDPTAVAVASEVQLRNQDGAYRWHSVSANPIPAPDGSLPTEWLWTALDIDDIATARNTLEHATSLLRIAVESANAGAWDWDMRTGMITLARESVQIYGLPGDQEYRLSAAEWTQLLNADDRGPTWDNVRHAIDTHSTYRADYRVSKGGAERWLRASGQAFYDAEGQPYRMVGLHFDVTDRKIAEAALKNATAAADSARIEAEQANTAKSEFLATMSHEIRTPLNSILGYAELMLDSDHHREDDRRYLELVQSSGFALLTVVNDILDFSKIEAGRLELDPTIFGLHETIDNAVSIVAGTSLKRPLTIACEIDPALPSHVTGDEARLKQVLLNLLNNAVKFTPAGSVTLRVIDQGSRTLKDGAIVDALRFEVADTGIGIAPHQRQHLFKHFSQVDGSISRRFGGSGLGLAICQRLVAMMGGEIGVDSQLGAGSTFWFTLELVRSEAHAALEPMVEPVTTTGLGSLQSPMAEATVATPKHLLLVEDVAINQELARAVLEARGYRVDVVSDGVGAVAAIQAEALLGDGYDAVLMDVQMPDMDGLTATRRVRALGGSAASVPIIAMTANVLPSQIEDLRAAGMDDHVGKPFKRAELYTTIDRWVSRRSTTSFDEQRMQSHAA